MNWRRIKDGFNSRRGSLAILAISLLLAVFMRASYNLWQPHSVTVHCRILLDSPIEGYEANSLSEEVLWIDAEAKGYDIRKFSQSERKPLEVSVTLEPEYIRRDLNRDDYFLVNSHDLYNGIVEFFGSDLDISYIEEKTLSFHMIRQGFKRVPIEVRQSLEFAPQYMTDRPLELIPDSVNVYGREQDLHLVDHVSTATIDLEDLDRTTRGSVSLNEIPGFRLERNRVDYVVNVVRYVEFPLELDVRVLRIPRNRSVTVLPSKVDVLCKVPYGTHLSASDFSLTVDFRTVSGGMSTKAVPVLRCNSFPVYEYRLDPPIVECLIRDRK